MNSTKLSKCVKFLVTSNYYYPFTNFTFQTLPFIKIKHVTRAFKKYVTEKPYR